MTTNDKTKSTRRSRRVATAPATILANCIAELDKLSSDTERDKVLRSIHAFYGAVKLGWPARETSEDSTIRRSQAREGTDG